MKAGIEARDRDEPRALTRSPSIPSARRCRSSSASADGAATMYTKGAPEVILAKCASGAARRPRVEPLTDDAPRARSTTSVSRMAARALRVLALAYRRASGLEREASTQEDRPDLRRPGRHDRSAPRGGQGRRRARCRAGRHPPGDDHRRPSGHGAGHRPRAAASPATATDVVTGSELDALDRRRAGATRSSTSPSTPASRPSTSCASCDAWQAPRPGRGHDRRRRERRAGRARRPTSASPWASPAPT